MVVRCLDKHAREIILDHDTMGHQPTARTRFGSSGWRYWFPVFPLYYLTGWHQNAEIATAAALVPAPRRTRKQSKSRASRTR